MSAWQIFSALGFYPLQTGSPYYAIGSPLFTKATVNLPNGRKIVIHAEHNDATNVYVQSLRVNDKRYDKTYLPHDWLAGGAVLDFTMGPRPSAWGADGPPVSLTKGSDVATPLRDVSTVGGPLFDNTSSTQATLTGPLPTVRATVADATQPVHPVTFYTLTSGSVTGDPTDWVLEGSNDGSTWTTVDQRTGETFDARRQTRPFKVQHPGTFSQYRLTIDKGTGGGGVTLAEVELLANGPTSAITASPAPNFTEPPNGPPSPG
jgi:hypothetical protein